MTEFRPPKYAGPQNEYVTCQECAGEMWSELEPELEKLAADPAKVREYLENELFIFYADERLEFHGDETDTEWVTTIYHFTLTLSEHERLFIELDKQGKYKSVMYCFSQHGFRSNEPFTEQYKLDYPYESVETLYQIGLEWLVEQPFHTKVQFQKYMFDRK